MTSNPTLESGVIIVMAAGSNGVLKFFFLSRQVSLFYLVRTLHIKPSGSVNFRNARLVK